MPIRLDLASLLTPGPRGPAHWTGVGTRGFREGVREHHRRQELADAVARAEDEAAYQRGMDAQKLARDDYRLGLEADRVNLGRQKAEQDLRRQAMAARISGDPEQADYLDDQATAIGGLGVGPFGGLVSVSPVAETREPPDMSEIATTEELFGPEPQVGATDIPVRGLPGPEAPAAAPLSFEGPSTMLSGVSGIQSRRDAQVQEIARSAFSTLPRRLQEMAPELEGVLQDVGSDALPNVGYDTAKAQEIVLAKAREIANSQFAKGYGGRGKRAAGGIRPKGLEAGDERLWLQYADKTEDRLQARGYFDRRDAYDTLRKAIRDIQSGNGTSQKRAIYSMARANEPGGRLTDKDVEAAAGFKSWLQRAKEFADVSLGEEASLPEDFVAQIVDSLISGMDVLETQISDDYSSAKRFIAPSDLGQNAIDTTISVSFEGMPFLSVPTAKPLNLEPTGAPAKSRAAALLGK